MGEVYSHLSEEERQVIQIEVGNGASISIFSKLVAEISDEEKSFTFIPNASST